MTKEETVALVERMWASWGARPENPEERKHTYAAWHEVLADLSGDACNEALTRLVIADRYRPRPGAVRREVILPLEDRPPTKAEAWAAVQARREMGMTGSPQTDVLHPMVHAAMTACGGPMHLSTGGDRDFFLGTYTQMVEEWEARVLTPHP